MKALLASACLTLSLILSHGIALAQTAPGPALGSVAPNFTLKTADGRTISLDSYRGKVVVLNFWATWCPPCRLETPDLIASYGKLHAPDVAFLSVDSTEKAPIIRAFAAAKGLPYPVGVDADQAVEKAYDVLGIPTTFVIDTKGIIRARNLDVVTPKQLVAYVADAKAERNSSITSQTQSKIDAALSPALFDFNGNRDAVLKSATAVNAAIDATSKMQSDADPAKGEYVDELRTQTEQAVLLNSLVGALQRVASSDGDKLLLARLQGDLAVDREQWSPAVSFYQAALALDAKSKEALSGLGFAQYELHDWTGAIATDNRLLAIDPQASTYTSLGVSYQQVHDYPQAIAAHKKAVRRACPSGLHGKAGSSNGDRARARVGVSRTRLCCGRRSRQCADRVRKDERIRP